MDFMTAAKTGFNKLTDFDGTAGRAEYWWFVLAVVIVMIVVNIILTGVLGMVGSLIGQIIGAGLLVAATARRLRDAGRPPVLSYVYFGLGIVLGVLPMIGMGGIVMFAGIAMLVFLIVMIVFLVSPSKGAAAAS